MKETVEREQLPTPRVVTFLFSDIEGSTWLLQHLGDAYDDVLDEHRFLLRGAWAEHGGHEIGTEGDSFFVAFDDAGGAVRAALDGQRRLAQGSWTEAAPIRVRMGIHTGDSRYRNGDYSGLAVHQAARIASAAHGGQIIVSDATRLGAMPTLTGLDFADLGLHRLKDLAQPIRLFQVLHRDLEATFPPPRTLAGTPHNFPIQTTPFIGRHDDVAGVAQRVEDGRVVTVTGAGGVGKTRLALQAAAEVVDEFGDGAWLVDLSPVSEPSLVPSATASVLGIREQPGRSMTDTLVDALVAKELLIVLDNCEHLIDAAAALVGKIAERCPRVKVLATSREALGIPGEESWRLRSLTVPAEHDVLADAVASCESVAVFVQRATAVRPDFALDDDNAPAVAQICRRLDGLPLAIELAAARARSMSVNDIALRLDDRFRLLTGGSRLAMPRQRTLEAAVAWSYDLLSEADQSLFDRLSVFSGGFTLEAAEAVCTHEDLGGASVMDIVDRLVERSLLTTEITSGGGTRYRLLETLKQFARDRLVSRGCGDEVRAAHLRWAVAVAERIPPQTTGGERTLEAVEEEDNFRTAIEWASETGDSAAALRITGAVWVGHFNERERLYQRLLPPGPETPADVAGKALYAGGALAFMMGEWARGAERLHAAVRANRDAGNRHLVALSLDYEGLCVWGMGDSEEARRLINAALIEARSAGDPIAETRALLALGWLATETDLDHARDMALAGIALAQDLADVFELGHLQELLGFVLCLKEELVEAALALAEAADTFRRIQHNCAAHMLETAAAWAVMRGDLVLGGRLWGSAARVREETQDKPRPWERPIHDVWLPMIRDGLAPDHFDEAHSRCWRIGVEDALEFLASALRAAASGVDDPAPPPRSEEPN